MAFITTFTITYVTITTVTSTTVTITTIHITTVTFTTTQNFSPKILVLKYQSQHFNHKIKVTKF